LVVGVVKVAIDVLVDALTLPSLAFVDVVVIVGEIPPTFLGLTAALVSCTARVLVGIEVRIVALIRVAVAIVHGIVVHAKCLLDEQIRE